MHVIKGPQKAYYHICILLINNSLQIIDKTYEVLKTS